MWTEALPLAFGASIYPPAVLALVVLLRRPPIKARALGFTAGAFVVTFAAGAVMLVVFGAAGVHAHTQRQLGAGIDIAAGVLLLAVAVIVARGGRGDRPKKPPKDAAEDSASGRGRAFALGFVMYTPSLLWASAIKQVAASGLSTGGDALVLALLAFVVISMTAIPVAAAIAWPDATRRRLEQLNELIGRYGRRAIVVVLAIAGAGLIIKGVVVALG